MKTKLFALTSLSAALLLAGCNGSDNNNTVSSTSSVCTGSEGSSERIFLQQLTDNSVIIKWRGDASAVCIGTRQNSLTVLVDGIETEADCNGQVFL